MENFGKYIERRKQTVYDCKIILNLYCLFLRKSEIFSYIQEYHAVFKQDIKEQLYIYRLLKENHETFKAQKTITHVLLYHVL